MDYSVNVHQVKTGKALASFSFTDEKRAKDFYNEIVKAQWHIDVNIKLLNVQLNEYSKDTIILDNILYAPAT